MATLYRKTYPMDMPAGAEIITRRGKPMARWVDGRGNTKMAPLHEDGERIMYVSDVWYARYVDADGRDRRVSTGCREKQAAQKVLADIRTDIEKVRSGLLTPAEMETAGHVKRPLTEHVSDYLEHLKTKRVRGRKVSAHYRRNVESRLNRLLGECGFRKVGDITAEAVVRWLEDAENASMAASTRNEYLATAKAFCGWMKRSKRMSDNPLSGVQKADQASDRRHVRRALTVDEVGRLLRVARHRPVAEVGRQSVPLPEDDKCGRSSWTFESLTAANFDACYKRGVARLTDSPDRREQLEKLGRQRARFYLLAVSTGLRRKELASLTVGNLHLDVIPSPYVELSGRDTKNGHNAHLPLRPDVVAELRRHLDDLGHDLPLDRPLFDSPPAIRVFDADCQAAGIEKTDARGRVVDIHALRTTFCTHLAVAGVHPRVAQQAMRHSRMELTNEFYTDPILLDVAGAVNSLPDFSGSQDAAKRALAASPSA